MANTFSFEEALRPTPQPQQPQTFSFEEAITPTAPTTFSFEEALGGAPKEEPGFIGSFTSALKERVETAAPAAKLFFGVGDQAKSTEELLAARQKAADEYKQTEFSDIGEAFRQGKYGDALSKTYDKFKEVAGSSFGAMAPAMGAGAAAAFAAPAAVPAALAGTAAYGITALGSYIADNIARQKEEQKARGKEGEDINRLTASAAATGQTALDIFGFKFFKPLGQLVGLEGKAAADRAAMEIIESATRPGAYRRAVASGAARGIAFEVPQEVSQQLLERWQAGLEVNPFTDPTAAKEYLEAAGGALLLGGPMGAVSRVAQTRTAKKLAGDERELDEQADRVAEEVRASAAREGAPVAPIEEAGVVVPAQEVPSVVEPTEPVAAGVEPSTGVPSVGAPVTPGGVEASIASGLDIATQLTGEPVTGAAAEPVALTPSLPTYEEAQAVLDTQPNKDQLQITEAPDGGFVVAQRAPSVAPITVPSVAPAEMVGEAAPSPAVEPVAEAVEPSAAPAVTEAVEAQPAVAPAEALEKELGGWEGVRAAVNEANTIEGTTYTLTQAYPSIGEESVEGVKVTRLPDGKTVVTNQTTDRTSVFAASQASSLTDEELIKRTLSRTTDFENLSITPTPEAVITEEPSVAETPEAVEAKEERPQEAAPATELEALTNQAAESAVTAKVNRKNAEAQKEQMRYNKALTTAVTKAIKSLQKLSTPIKLETLEAANIKDERAIAVATAAEAQRKAELAQAKETLFLLSKRRDLTQPSGKPWKARQMAIDAVANFTPEERAKLEAAYAEETARVLKSTRLPIASVTAPDAAFEQMTDAQQALRYIINKGNAFEKLLAQRLLSAVKGVQFVVIGPKTKIPDVVANAMSDTTQGVYYKNVIYVRDTSFGDVHGVNNTVVLHEALHAATSKKLDYGLALTEKQLNRDIPLQAFVGVMSRAMNRAESVYLKIKSDGRSNDSLDDLYKNGAFSDIREFVSYGLTDKVMQSFLANIPGDIKGTSFFTKFVQAIRKLFNMAEQYQSALQDLIVSTDALIGMKLPPDAALITATPAQVQAAKKTGKEAKKDAENLRDPVSAPEQNFSLLGEIVRVRSWDEAKPVISAIYNGTKDQYRDVLLGALSTRQLTELAAAKAMIGGDGKPALDNVLRQFEDMNGAKMEMLDQTASLAKEWHQWQQANLTKARTLNRLIHLSTINQVDPSVSPEKSKTLSDMYESLGEDGKALYNKIRDFYKARFMRYKQILVDRITATTVDEDTRKKLLAKLEKDFENLPEPYFPLVREGKYWVRIGSTRSRNMEYYMFEDPRERNFFVRQRANELGISMKDLMNDPSQFAMGDNYMEAIDEGMRNSKMVKDIAEIIDGATFTDTTEEGIESEKARLRDDIYQLYFSTLPEQNFRKHFLHRKGTAGFRADALRNFAKSSFHTSTQLAKIEYGDKLRKALDRAWDVTKDMPLREYLYQPIYREMKNRVDSVLAPEPAGAFGTRLANVLGSMNFVYYMSAPASALTNLTGLFVFGAPVLNGEFGAKANQALLKNMNIFKSVGVTNKDGGYTFPTLLSKLTGHRQQAYMEALRRGKIDTTLTYDTLQLSRTPSELYSGSAISFMNVVGYLFHHSEKINREVMFMTAYDLAHDRAKKSGRDDKTAYEEAVNEASRLTDEAMFDYSEFNKPRYFRGNLARVLLQFKTFAQQATYYMFKNYQEMTKGLDPQTRKAARTKFLGTMGMTAMFAGAMGLPLMSTIIFPLMGALLGDEDDEEGKRNPKLWFTKWLRSTFGESIGLALERGPISWATNVDFHSRAKLDQLWFRDIKSGISESEWLKEFMVASFGPTAGLLINAAKAKERIDNGQLERGIELLLPAGLRGFMVAERAKTEGYKTLKGDEVIPKDELSALDIWIIRSGFSPAKVGQINDRVSRGREVYDAIIDRHTKVYDMFKQAVKETEPKDQQRMFEKAIDELRAYNQANPMYAVSMSQIAKAINQEMEASAMAVNGMRVPKKLIPVVSGLVE